MTNAHNILLEKSEKKSIAKSLWRQGSGLLKHSDYCMYYLQ